MSYIKILRTNSSFRRLFIGRLVTNAGDSIYLVAGMWLAFELTGSSFYTGLAAFLIEGPRALQFLSGPLVDQWDLKRILIGTQLIQAVVIALLPLLAYTGNLSIWVLIIVLPIMSSINQFVYPTQNSVLPRILTDDELVKANSLFASAFQAADVVFKAVGGILVSGAGVIIIFLVDSATFLAAMLLFTGVFVPNKKASQQKTDTNDDGGLGQYDNEWHIEDKGFSRMISSYANDLLDGVAYIRGSTIMLIIAGTVLVNFAFGSVFAVLPVFAENLGEVPNVSVLTGAGKYGILLALLSAGSVTGSLLSIIFNEKPFGITCGIMFLISGLMFSGIVILPSPILKGVAFFVAFIPIGVYNVLFWSLVQSAVSESYMGRVSSVVTSISTSMMPIGSLLGGVVAEFIRVEHLFLVFSFCLFLLFVYFIVSSSIRRLPAVAEANENTAGLN